MLGSKKKVSIDFEADNYSILTAAAKESKSSNSLIINRLVRHILPVPQKILQELGDFCWDKYSKNLEKLHTITGIETQIIRQQAMYWRLLGDFFGHSDIKDPLPGNLKEVMLLDGLCILPKEWICLDNVFGVPADQCRSAYVVESRNSAKFGIPHFVVFSPDPPDYKYNPDLTPEQRATIFSACAKAFPDFTKFFNMQIELTEEEGRDFDKLKIWDSAPCFEIFNIAEKASEIYIDPITREFIPPYGSMIVRTSEKKS